jgi:D-alanyl-D-alanine carboxypeptidase/D-alanyl-D-alanine-endopeptidase (penicillin-binding protein 4)
MRKSLVALSVLLFICSCSPAHRLSALAGKTISSGALAHAHAGISIFETASNKYWYNYQGDKYFVPASNVKIATCYAAMKYLGKYLPGIKYRTEEERMLVFPTGDPTFLHADFPNQRVYHFLKNTDKRIYLSTFNWEDNRWGKGWAWDDYNEAFMAERSAMPVYGNLAHVTGPADSLQVIPGLFSASFIKEDSAAKQKKPSSAVQREFTANTFLMAGDKKEQNTEVPFITDTSSLIYRLLSDTLHKKVTKSDARYTKSDSIAVIHSQPADSLLKIMMHRSDNFLAEQALLMVSNEMLGVMNDEKVLDTLLKTSFKDLPQQPRWTDGSGLSRYNLFTPKDFVFILNRIKNEFGMERMKEILPTGNEGTLHHYYQADSGYIFAKTGTMSGVVALSGYLYTKKNRLLIFSVLVNNHNAAAVEIKKAIEKMLETIRKKF